LIISPSGTGNAKKISNGHVGIVLDNEEIASNDSRTGIFRKNYTIQSNACEPAFAIPGLAKKKWPDIKREQISWSFNPQDPLEGKKYSLYLYSPRFGPVDPIKLKEWEIVFLSKNWVIYKKAAK